MISQIKAWDVKPAPPFVDKHAFAKLGHCQNKYTVWQCSAASPSFKQRTCVKVSNLLW